MFLRKTFIAILVLFFIVSIFKDLTVGTVVPVEKQDNQEEKENNTQNKQEDPKQTNQEKDENGKNSYKIGRKEVEAGETVLSVIEQINQNDIPVPISQIIIDFKKLNPGVDPQQIEAGQQYLFPVYKNGS
ncbi:hypothetical protein NC797_10580 [Aquibacillus sp. 3ASR75-11]|uniref:LysM domain-containing protein n=1 Tax=Terrihalobacillus insolitus TaxID=2950438 RepID=A0A9X3WVG1_9BACI|nr:hypothetical protein [Terrihalobacillus insolitus]MDC3413373.1 hypothetical protein [Terrihalobacillus insolitus]MDC3424956.1 hypothetical protein [Terrihalobacillus insolitus]